MGNDEWTYEHAFSGERLTGIQLDPSGSGYVPTHWGLVTVKARTITDKYGREWTYKGRGDLYSHDGTLAFPDHMIDDLCLPLPVVASNPNYGGLCAACVAFWTDDERARLVQTVRDHNDSYGNQWNVPAWAESE